MACLEDEILQHLLQSPTRVTFHGLQKRFPLQKAGPMKKAVAKLVRYGRVGYSYEFGNSYLSLPVERPVLVSENVVLKPPNVAYDAAPDQAVVSLGRGSAFGLGDHPTTRLAIRLLDRLFVARRGQNTSVPPVTLDIGTGSGVLAIVAAKLGADSVASIDTDPCAVFEARANVRLNNLEDRIVVRRNLDAFENKRFDLFLANLRTPTLLTLLPRIRKMAATECGLVFSGFQVEEADQIRKRYEHAGFTPLKTCSEKNWCALSLARGDF